MSGFTDAIEDAAGSLLPRSDAVMSATTSHPYGEVPGGLRGSAEPVSNRELQLDVQSLITSASDVGAADSHTAAMYWCEAARVLERKLGRPDDAWICYGAALLLDPRFELALAGIGRLSRMAGADDVCLMALDEQLERDPDSPPCRSDWAVIRAPWPNCRSRLHCRRKCERASRRTAAG